jgi:hypothetical protein
MNNSDEILKKILLNMRYNPKDSLVENKTAINVLLNEEPASPGQQIPTTMNQIMQFQDYIWSTIEKDLPATNPKETDRAKKLYNSMLCSVPKPCNKKQAVDGRWGGNTITAWNKYKEKYKKSNPDWDKDRVDYQYRVSGQEIPVTQKQIKNFQRWYFEEIEKAKETNPGTKLYSTKLCGNVPCTKDKAIDGGWGPNTISLWNTYKSKYITANPNWWAETDWSAKKEREDAALVAKQGVNTSKVFSPDNPSGWDGKSPLPSQAKMKKAYYTSPALPGSKWKRTYEEANYYYLGWDLNNNTFPYPKKYTDAEISAKTEQVKGFSSNKKKENEIPMPTYTIPTDTETGGLSRTIKQNEFNKQYYENKIETARYAPVKEMKDWNDLLSKQNTLIPQFCTPLKKTLSFENGEKIVLPQGMNSYTLNGGTVIYNGNYAGTFGLNITWYISMAEICQDNGGLWVTQKTENKGNWFSEKTTSTCLCRYMGNLNIDTLGMWGSGESGNVAETLYNEKTNKENSYSDYAHAAATVLEIGLAIASLVVTAGASGGVVSSTLIAGSELSIAAEAAGVGAVTIAGSASAAALAANLMVGSTVAGVLDAATYYAEGDKYMGGMMMALSLIPGGEAISLLKKANTFITNGGKEGLEVLLKKKAAKTLTSEELIQLEKIQIELAQNSDLIKYTTTQRVNNITGKNLYSTVTAAKATLKDTVKLIGYLYSKVGVFPKLVFQVGVSTYGFDELYLAIYGRDEDRQNSDIRKLYYMLRNKELPENIQYEIAEKAQDELMDKLSTSTTLVIDSKAMSSTDISMYMVKSYNQRKPNTKIIYDVNYSGPKTPSLLDVENEDEYMYINMSGNSVSELQEIIKTRWKDSPYNEMLEKDFVEGVFNQNMEKVIKKFQSELKPESGFEKMKVNGVVDSNTIKYIKYSKQNLPEPLEPMKIKPLEPYMLNHEKYNFFRWSERKQLWDPVDYETYIKYKNLGTKVDARYKDVELKQSKPVTVEPEKKKGLFKNRSLNEEIENVRRLLLNKK